MLNAKITVIPVHGAWAECASWNEIILPLQNQGLKVVCAPIPLTTLSDDLGALDRVLDKVGGVIVVVGHAYAGAVIGAAKNERVKLLVYVAALAPDEGETVADALLLIGQRPLRVFSLFAPRIQPKNTQQRHYTSH